MCSITQGEYNEDKLKKLAALDKLINEQIENIKIKEYDIFMWCFVFYIGSRITITTYSI